MINSKSRRAETRRDNKKTEKEEYINRPGKKFYGLDIPKAYETLDVSDAVKKELQENQGIIESQYKVYQSLLPGIMLSLGYIKDVRQPEKVKHKLKALLLYGILLFSFNICTRRSANTKRSSAIFLENINTVFPEIKQLPHADTLARVLEKIDVDNIEKAMINLIKEMATKKRFKNFMYKEGYVIAIDGTQKFKRDRKINAQYLERTVTKTNDTKSKQYYVYVLEAVMIFSNGMKLPFMSEFLNYEEYKSEAGKQDCELKAIKRLADRIKKEFKRSKITILLDGLYANGPIIDMLKKYNWGYMIVLKDKSLTTVWEDVYGLKKHEDNDRFLKNIDRRKLAQKYGDRNQRFWWVNEVEYDYHPEGKKRLKTLILNVVVCEERRTETDKNGKTTHKKSRHAWLSDTPITKRNVHHRCNLLGRFRWKIENNILMEKCHGYNYEHCHSENWNALRGFHYLMHIGHVINEIAIHTIDFTNTVKKLGGQVNFVKKILEILIGFTLDRVRFEFIRKQKHQLRFDW